MAYFPSSKRNSYFSGSGSAGKVLGRGIPDEENDPLSQLLKTIGTKQTGGGQSGWLAPVHGALDLAGRGMDLLSRGNYASAELFDSIIDLIEGDEDTQNIGDLLSNVGEGITGKRKTTFSDVISPYADEIDLSILGIPSTTFGTKLGDIPGGTATAGFGLDVFLDPLNYVGLGLISKADDVTKAGGSLAKRAGRALEGTEEAARKAVIDTVGSPTAHMNRLEEVTRLSIDEAGGPEAWRGLTKGGKDKIKRKVRKALEDRDFSVADDLMKAERAEAAPELGFKVYVPGSRGRRTIDVPIPGSGVAGRAVQNAIGSIPAARVLNRAFRTDAAYGVGYQQAARTVEAANAANFEAASDAFANGLRTALGGAKLSRADKELVARALDTGASTGTQHLDEVADYYRAWFDKMAADEVAMGLLKEDEVLGAYFPHYYKKEPPSTARRKVVANRVQRVGAARLPFEQGRTLVDEVAETRKLEDAFKESRRAGLEPITDPEEALRRRLADHFNAKARYDFLDEATSIVGVSLPTKVTDSGRITLKNTAAKRKRTLLRRQGYKNLNEIWGAETTDLAKYVGNLTDGRQIWIPPEAVDSFKSLQKIHLRDSDAAEIGKWHRKVLNVIKQNLTINNPAFHVRNFRGDLQLNYIAGVRDPRLYQDATRILNANRVREAGDITQGLESLLGASPRLAKMRVTIGGQTYTGEEIMTLFRNSGSKSGFITYETEIPIGAVNKVRTAGRGVADKVRTASEFREDIPRMAHFLHVLKTEGKHAKSIEDLIPISKQAGARVRKHNIDYGDLTEFEQKLKAYGFPFYTWFRKNVPLQLEMMFTRPGVQAQFAKSYNFVDELYGDDSDTIVPQWLAEIAPIEVRRSGQNKLLSAALAPFVPGAGANLIPGNDPTFITGGSVPLVDALNNIEPLFHLAQGDPQEAFTSASREVTDQLNPLAGLVLEQGAGTNFFTGAPVDEPIESVMGLFPLARAPGLISEGIGGNDPVATQKLLNFLFAADLQTITPQRQQSELRRREDILDAIIRQERTGMGEEAHDELKKQRLAQAEAQEAVRSLFGG